MGWKVVQLQAKNHLVRERNFMKARRKFLVGMLLLAFPG